MTMLLILLAAGLVVACIISMALGISKGIREGNWHASENGNQTRVHGGLRVTVFQSDDGWKYCVAEPQGDDRPFFSDPYPTQQAAMESAIAEIDGRTSPHKTKRELRDETLTSFYIDAATKAPAVYADLHAQLLDMSASFTYQLTRLRPIKRRSGQQIAFLKDAYQHYYTEGQNSRADEIWALRDRFNKLEVSTAALIDWMESGTKATRGAPPQIDV